MAAAASVLRWVGDGDFSAWMMAPEAMGGEPWRLLTSCLLHGDPVHLLFNLYWLWILGTRVEETVGSTRVALGYVAVGAGSSAAEWALSSGGIGLSGIGYGLFGFLWVASRRDPRFSDAMPTQTAKLFVAWFFLCIVLTVLDLWRIGNVAHGSGAVLGALFGFAELERHYQRKLRMAGVAGLVSTLTLIAVGAAFFRPQINFSGSPGRAHADEGLVLLEEHDPARADDAVAAYRSALAIDDSVANWWFNYGVALERTGDREACIAAYEHALDLEPSDPTYRSAVAAWRARGAYEADASGDFDRAIDLYRMALEVEPDHAGWWTNLSIALEMMDRHAEADLATERAGALGGVVVAP